ncbi:hypothetical protein MBRU_18880 [Mycolicibacterium brumae DSM 44177]|nr:hypothetical protein MBRU_18880 [Mycolicibacterium brumae DSM 44177]
MSRGFQRERLSALLAESGMARSDVARLAGVAASTLNSWERRGGEPDIERLARVVRLLDVEIAEVVVVPDDECMPSDLRVRRGMTQMQLGQAAGLSTTVVSGFERGETRWSPRKAEKLAPVLGVSVGELEAAWLRAKNRPAGTKP